MRSRAVIALFAASFLAPLSRAVPVELNFISRTGSSIVFQNGSFSFLHDSGSSDFFIYGSTQGNTAFGLTGNITGTYGIDAITPGLPATAPVSGVGQLEITDGSLNKFTATLEWVDITQSGPSDSLNLGGQINLTNFQYNGINPALVALASNPNGIANLNAIFPATGYPTLKQLKETTTPISRGYTGNVSAVPEPMFSGVAVVGGFVGLLLIRRHRTRLAQAQL